MKLNQMSPHVLDAAALGGRVLLSGLFLNEAWGKLTDYAAAARYMDAFAIPGEFLAFVIALEVVCGLAILLGYYTRAAAMMLALFCIAAAVVFHTKFADRNQVLHFEKDLAIAGGLLILFAQGGGAWTLERLQYRHK